MDDIINQFGFREWTILIIATILFFIALILYIRARIRRPNKRSAPKSSRSFKSSEKGKKNMSQQTLAEKKPMSLKAILWTVGVTFWLWTIVMMLGAPVLLKMAFLTFGIIMPLIAGIAAMVFAPSEKLIAGAIAAGLVAVLFIAIAFSGAMKIMAEYAGLIQCISGLLFAVMPFVAAYFWARTRGYTQGLEKAIDAKVRSSIREIERNLKGSGGNPPSVKNVASKLASMGYSRNNPPPDSVVKQVVEELTE